MRPLGLVGRFGGIVLLMFLAFCATQAGPLQLKPQLITLPDDAGQPMFVDATGNGRRDLLVIDQAAKKLWCFRQRQDGFTNSPDQVIPLPPQTAWVTLCDVDPQPGLELLASTATGLAYSRQNAGRFESEWHTLVAASQVFSNSDFPVLILLNTNQTGTNVAIPVISAGATVSYHRNSAYEWNAGPSTNLSRQPATWSVNHDQWVMGANPSYHLRTDELFRIPPSHPKDRKPGGEAIGKILDDMREHFGVVSPIYQRADLAGDGRQDLVLAQVGGTMDLKTDVYVFMCGPDGRLPQHPTQILHREGMPISTGQYAEWSLLHDLKGDGTREMVLIEFSTSVFSADGLLKTALAHGLDWTLTIRAFRHGAFSRLPDASLPLTMTLPAESLIGWTILIPGDFNGDSRPDLVVRRSDTQWNVFFSTTDGRWFAPEPALTFETPASGYMEVQDLTGDGRSDIIWHQFYKHNLSIFLSPSPPPRGKTP